MNRREIVIGSLLMVCGFSAAQEKQTVQIRLGDVCTVNGLRDQDRSKICMKDGQTLLVRESMSDVVRQLQASKFAEVTPIV